MLKRLSLAIWLTTPNSSGPSMPANLELVLKKPKN